MNPDLRDYARLLLRREPTHSLPLGVLREQLRVASGRAAGPLQVEQALGGDPCFRFLSPPPLMQAPGSSYLPEQLAAGFPQPEPRVLLVEAPAASDEAPGWLGSTGESLLALLGRDGGCSEVAEAVAALAEIGAKLAAATSPTPDAGARSTTPPPDPPRPPKTRRQRQPPSSPPPRWPGCR